MCMRDVNICACVMCEYVWCVCVNQRAYMSEGERVYMYPVNA